MLKKLHSGKYRLIILGLAGLGIVLALSYAYQRSKNPVPSTGGGGVNEDLTGPTDTPQASIDQTGEGTDNTHNPPAKPELLKSSGNNGPVPRGVAINFICNSEPGVSCNIILEKSSGEKKELGEKEVVGDGHGGYFASWNWDAIMGIWNVYAEASRGSQRSQSDKQELKVQ